MELDTLSPDLPQLLVELGIRYDPDKLAAVLASKWPQVGVRAGYSQAGNCTVGLPATLTGGVEQRV